VELNLHLGGYDLQTNKKEKIEKLREQLNKIVVSGAHTKDEVLKVSEEIDHLIVKFIKEKNSE
jgi:hypothetical protein